MRPVHLRAKLLFIRRATTNGVVPCHGMPGAKCKAMQAGDAQCCWVSLPQN